MGQQKFIVYTVPENIELVPDGTCPNVRRHDNSAESRQAGEPAPADLPERPETPVRDRSSRNRQ